MDKLTFFAPDDYTGVQLTSTSANYIANLAKEYYRSREIELESLIFYSTDLTIIGSQEESVIGVGLGSEELKNIPTKINEIAAAKSLIAWLREAIKAKENMLNDIKNHSMKVYIQTTGEKEPEKVELGSILTEEEYYNSLPIKERNEYYELEAIAATIGKYIHEQGSFAQARTDLSKRINNPTAIKGTGRDTLIYRYKPNVTLAEVDTVYFMMQTIHREIQARLNAIKNKCSLAINASAGEAYAKYESEQKRYSSEYEAFRNRVYAFVQSETERISKLKIIIPNSLQEIYQKISSLGK